jgi:hypothetical protein
MANSVTIGPVAQGTNQFQGAFKEMWKVTTTAVFDTDVGADAGVEFTVTVPNVALGDGVICLAPQGGDGEPNDFTYTAEVVAANTLSIAVKNAGAANTPLVNGFKVLVGRPSW